MPRTTRDSDDEERKIGSFDRARLLTSQSVVNSPLRRSSRIKQNRSSSVSPGSDTSSINSTQPVRVTRKRTLIMESASLDVSKEHTCSFDPSNETGSISSDTTEIMDIEIPSKRITRKSMSTVTTPTKINTRSSKRFVRAGSETKSSPAVKTTRRTRASSVDPEILPGQSQSNTPIKSRRHASVLPSNSPVKEEEELLIPYVRLDHTIFEETHTHSATSSPNKSSHSQQNQKVNEKHKTIDKDKAEKEANRDAVTSSSSEASIIKLSETSDLSQNNSETHDNSNNSAQKTLDSSLNTANEMKIILKRQSLDYNAEKVSSDLINIDSPKSLSDNNVSSSINEKSNQSVMKNSQSAQIDVINLDENLDLTKEEESQTNVSEHKKELESSNNVEAIEATPTDSDTHKTVVQGNESFSINTEDTTADVLPAKESINRNVKQSMDNLDNLNTKNNSQLKKTPEDEDILIDIINSDSESNIGISLFSNIVADEQEKKTENEDNNADESDKEHNLHSMKQESDNESEAECDLVLVDKQAWLAAESIKVAREAREESSDDSDDTVVRKSKLDAARANSGNRVLNVMDEEVLINLNAEENDVSPIEIKKSLKILEKKPKKDVESSIECEDVNNSTVTDKSVDDSKLSNLNRSNSKNQLIKSEQVTESDKTVRRFSETCELDENADNLNKTSRTSKQNTPHRKSLRERESLNKSSKDTLLKQSDARDIVMDECETNKSQKETDMMEISQERRSLNESHNKTNDTTEEKKSKKKKRKSLSSKDDSKIEEQTHLDRSTKKNSKRLRKPLINVNDEDSNDSMTVLPAMDLAFENFSTVVHVGSTTEYNPDDSENTSDSNIASNKGSTSLGFKKSDNDDEIDNDIDENSVNSDVRKEYNLDGAEQKFDDNDVLHDECRVSESEYSDPNDNGSDLADFIVDDDEVQVEEKEENEDSNEEQEQNDKEQEEEEEDNETEQSEEEDEREKKEVVDNENKKHKNQNANKDFTQIAEIKCVINKTEDADDEYSEGKIILSDSSERDDKDESAEIIDESKAHSIEIISSRISEPKKKQAETQKSRSRIREETILLDTSDPDIPKSKKTQAENEEIISLASLESSSPIKIKRQSLLRSSEKSETEQDSLKQLSKTATSQFSRKLSKVHAQVECSTPKLNSSKSKINFNVDTPEEMENIQKSKDNKNEAAQDTSSGETRLKNSTVKRNISLINFSPQNEHLRKSLNSSLPLDIAMKVTGTENISKSGVSKTIESRKTKSIINECTETPTIRHLRKEKLNETAPATQLDVEQAKNKSSTIEEKENVTKPEIEEINYENVPNLEPSNNNNTRKRKRQRKHKRRSKEIADENVIDKTLFEDTIELEASRKKKRFKLSEGVTIEDDICKEIPDINQEKTKKKRKKIDVSNESENLREADTQKNRQETDTQKHKKDKKIKSSGNSVSDASTKDDVAVKKKSEQREEAQSEETSLEKSTKKKKKQRKEENAPLVETKAKTKTKSNNPYVSQAATIESANIKFAKARHEALEAIRAAEMRIKAKELKKKMREANEKENQDRVLQIQKQNLSERDPKVVGKKRKRETKEEASASVSSFIGNLQRLPGDVIQNLSDTPIRVAKRQQTERPITASSQSKRIKTTKNIGFESSSSGSTTKFTVINLQKIKKQPPKESAAVMSLRQRIQARNKREPISAYLKYLEKQRASSNKGPSNAF